MTHHALRPRLLTTLALLLALALPAPAAHTAEWDLATLMQTLAANPGGRVRFVETRHLAILDQPLESRGELVYRAPSRLERHNEAPLRESMVLDGDTLSLTREGRTHNLRLRDYPEAAALIESIRATLAGDLASLQRSYAVSLSGRAEAWTLHLLPSDPQLAQLVLRIRIDGSQGLVNAVEILQADGDRSSMRIEPPAR
jgi:outer membrane lipoprotein-sorting protein